MWDWFINFLYAVLQGIQGFVGDWGLSVICLTIIIRVILMPLQTKSVKSTAGMQVMQPRIQEIQEKYADDPQRLQEEKMKIYSEMNVNPLMGCLPLLLQMPVFFALFTVIKMVPEGSCFYSILPSISDSVSGMLAASGFVGALPYIIMDVLFGVLTFVPMWLNSQTVAPEQRSQQMTMGAVMSVMMLWFGWTCPAAVLLYYVTSSLWQVVQQQLVTKKVMEKAKADAAERAKNAPLEVNVTRKEKKPRQHKKN